MSSPPAVQLNPRIPGREPLYSGKVRDVYAVHDDHLLIVASDRISAFDYILAEAVPDKGRVLTSLSSFWFARTAHIVPNHVVSTSWPEIAAATGIDPRLHGLQGRSMLVQRAGRIGVECVVRGYLAGSGWEEYCDFGTLAGRPLAPGMRESEILPAPTFTPAIKNDSGHDQNITVQALTALVGSHVAERLEQISIQLYIFAQRHAASRGIILADTKFEFGMRQGQMILIDELLTPDSSRFWAADRYQPGGPQPSFDKQPVRDFLAASGWDRHPPVPHLPANVVAATTARYHEAHRLLTDCSLDG